VESMFSMNSDTATISGAARPLVFDCIFGCLPALGALAQLLLAELP
jgi:hypothetical protein